VCLIGFSSSGLANPLKGYAKINSIVHERIAKTNGFELGQYLDKVETIPNGDLLSLLGTYDGSDTNSTFHNGAPNTLNMLLWYIAFNKLSDAIASNCSGMTTDGSNLVLIPQFAAALKPLCAWPAKSAQSDGVLYGFWSAILSYDAPPEEFQAWKTFFLSESSYQGANASTVISDMALSALYNPYFLLED
jgi:hypothetical protein